MGIYRINRTVKAVIFLPYTVFRFRIILFLFKRHAWRIAFGIVFSAFVIFVHALIKGSRIYRRRIYFENRIYRLPVSNFPLINSFHSACAYLALIASLSVSDITDTDLRVIRDSCFSESCVSV